MPGPLITVVVCLPDGAEYTVRSAFPCAPLVGDTLTYGGELELDVWDRRIGAGATGELELRTTIVGPPVDDELVIERLARLRFRKRS